MMKNFEQVLEAIQQEIDYQDHKWGECKEQSLPGYLLIMQKKINDAIDGWMDNSERRDSALGEVVQVVTTGIRCLQTYGIVGSAISTNDLVEKDKNVTRPDYETNSKVITLTMTNGSPVHIGKAVILGVYPRDSVSQVMTRNGIVEVLETVETINELRK